MRTYSDCETLYKEKMLIHRKKRYLQFLQWSTICTTARYYSNSLVQSAICCIITDIED